MACLGRTYPLNQPPNHRPPVPRWQLKLPENVGSVQTTYVGIQQHDDGTTTTKAASQACADIEAWLASTTGVTEVGPRPGPAMEAFTVLSGDDVARSPIWVLYWSDPESYKTCMARLSISALHSSLATDVQGSVGIWLETFKTPTTHLETNYSGLDYLPGLARLPDTMTQEHTLTAYWGAARDRIPGSAHDLFQRSPEADAQDDDNNNNKVAARERTAGGGGKPRQHLVGSNYDNLVHIRSGQYWETCGPEEREAYETKLEPTLQAGLAHLRANRAETGTIGLRYLQNTRVGTGASSSNNKDGRDVDADDGRRESDGQGGPGHSEPKETCVTGFFSSLDRLEDWAKKHRTHLAIYGGAMKHAKDFGAARKFRTWHEVSVLKKGEARFEYVNCAEGTGVIGFVALDSKE